MRRNVDLLAVAACVLVSLAIFGFVDDPFVRVAPTLAMVLFVPGYAMSVWLFPAQTLERLERLLLAVGISLSSAVIGALVLDRAAAHLTARSWADELAAVAAVGVAGASWRRRGLSVRCDEESPTRITLGPLLIVSLGAAAAVASVVGAIAMARQPAGHGRGATVLWARAESRALGTYALGVASNELGTTSYLVTGTVAGKVVLRRTLTLPSGRDWQMTGSVGGLPASSRVLQISLYKRSAPTVLYRQVALAFGPLGS